MAVLGDVADAGGERAAHAGAGDVARRRRGRGPPVGTRRPVIASTSSDWPLPSTPAMPTISPARTCRDRPRSAGSPRSSIASRSSTSSSGSPGVAAVLLDAGTARRGRPSAWRGSPPWRPRSATVSIFLPRRSTVTRSAISSTSRSLCVMKMTETPSAVSARSTLNSSAISCAVSTAVGSSRISTSAPRCSTRRISTRCCWPTPMSSTQARGSTREAEALRQLAHALLGRVAVEQRALARLGGEHDVLGHRHDRDQHEVLVHHADPHADRLARRADVHRLAAEEDLALVGLVEPVEDVHERGLPRAVLPEQGVHLTATQVEVDAVVRDERAEALGDALQLEGERGALIGQVLRDLGRDVGELAGRDLRRAARRPARTYFSPSALTSP